MINENKVILMTRMASYEQKEGKRCMSIAKYFRTDYVLRHILKGIISGTIAFVICFALYVAYGFEEFMENIYKMDLFAFASNVIVIYIVFVAAYGIILYLVSTFQFIMARRSLRCYYQNLKKLKAMYEEK